MDEVNKQQDPLEKRLICAQMLNELIKQDFVLRWRYPKSQDSEILTEIEGYVKNQLKNLLLKVMGEHSDSTFSEEEVQILKVFASKLRNKTGVI